LAIAQGLDNTGAAVVVTGPTLAWVEAALASLHADQSGAQVRGVIAGIGTLTGCQTLMAAESTADVLFNNLGIYKVKDFFALIDADWDEIFQVNVMGGVRLSRHYVPAMQAQGWGRIQFISSESGLNIPTEMLHHGVSKAML
jgi:NAD(P)-dependent dehydrogenase (short-subunit alcohol dehydrogenase family)